MPRFSLADAPAPDAAQTPPSAVAAPATEVFEGELIDGYGLAASDGLVGADGMLPRLPPNWLAQLHRKTLAGDPILRRGLAETMAQYVDELGAEDGFAAHKQMLGAMVAAARVEYEVLNQRRIASVAKPAEYRQLARATKDAHKALLAAFQEYRLGLAMDRRRTVVAVARAEGVVIKSE